VVKWKDKPASIERGCGTGGAPDEIEEIRWPAHPRRKEALDLAKEGQQERQVKQRGYTDRQEVFFTESAAPCPCPAIDVGQINADCNQKKILNRGNEAKVLLETKDLAEISASKRAVF
jgi:hypothetical protein